MEKKLETVINIGIAISIEKDEKKLYSFIVSKSIELTGSDTGILYIVKDDFLECNMIKSISEVYDDSEVHNIDIRSKNICAYAANNKIIVNIKDFHTEKRYEDLLPKGCKEKKHLSVKSMLVVPLVNAEDRVVGVLQLINAKDINGEVIQFYPASEHIIKALCSLAAISLSNIQYKEELKAQMWSFTEAMATAIDERTPYNASHTRMVAKYVEKIVDYINELHDRGEEEEEFSQNRKEQLIMATLLHDIGKLVTPLEVMNKHTRLSGREKTISNRLEIYGLKAKIAYLEGKTDKNTYCEIIKSIDSALDIMYEINGTETVGKILKEKLNTIINLEYDDDGMKLPFFTEEEKDCLKIVKGTLTAKERKVMEQHVEITARILDKVHFIKYFADTPSWAVKHHELLDGKGYPKGLKAEDICLEARIIAVADICDALLATDRPYKKPIPKEKAFEILREMANCGKIDGKLVEYLYRCI